MSSRITSPISSETSSEAVKAVSGIRRVASNSFAQDVGGIVHLRGAADVYAGVHRHFHSYPEHAHSFLEIVMVIGGSGIHDSSFGRDEVRAGDVLVIQPGLAHSYTDCRDLRVFNCGISRALLDRELRWTLENELLGPIVSYDRSPGEPALLQAHLGGTRFETTLSSLRRVEECRFSGSPTAPSDSIAHLLLFLGQLAAGAAGSWKIVRDEPLPPMIREAASLLKDNLEYDWSLTALAERLHMSPSHVSRQFSSTMGQPPLAYLARQRAEAAGRRLLDSDLPVARIGADVGWTDANYFARRFKSHFGMSPSEYRDQFRVVPSPAEGSD